MSVVDKLDKLLESIVLILDILCLENSTRTRVTLLAGLKTRFEKTYVKNFSLSLKFPKWGLSRSPYPRGRSWTRVTSQIKRGLFLSRIRLTIFTILVFSERNKKRTEKMHLKAILSFLSLRSNDVCYDCQELFLHEFLSRKNFI